MTERHRIRLLPPDVIGKIAAGEMIERPVSVLKELVENALDAGASAITITVDGRLDRSLVVSDDGHGMAADDLERALQRHATSKIESHDDLFRLASLGFRGEALPSIGAVSRMTITTSTADGAPATEIVVEGGETLSRRETSRRRGTTVEVRDLFFNVPVRRKFMKTERGELRAAVRLVSHIGLAFPSVRFVFERTGATSLVFDPVPGLRERAEDVYGRTAVAKMLSVERDGVTIAVDGLVGVPDQSRATRDFQVLIVNGRPVVSPLVNHAVKMGYRDLIPPDRHPMSILLLTLDPATIDVNVHPTKREVKFAREGLVFEVVRDAVADALSGLVPLHPHRGPVVRDADDAPFTGRDASGRPISDPNQVPIGVGDRRQTRLPDTDAILELYVPPAEPGAGHGAGEDEVHDGSTRDWRTRSSDAARARPDEAKFWQLHRRYVFAQTSSGVLIVDQHAAHERILYEEALARLDGAEASAQQLLIPQAIELTAAEYELTEELAEPLGRLGFDIEPFGGRTVLIRAIPGDLMARDHQGLLTDVLDEFVHAGRSVRETRERLARSFACRAAIKSGDLLSTGEMRSLIDQLFATSTPHGDPHGRATLIQMPLIDLDRRFGRT